LLLERNKPYMSDRFFKRSLFIFPTYHFQYRIE